MSKYHPFLNLMIHINLIFILILKYKIDDVMKCHWIKFIHPIVEVENDFQL
jgi:hypothetical protein